MEVVGTDNESVGHHMFFILTGQIKNKRDVRNRSYPAAMDTVAGLVLWLAPITVLAMLSPVVFLNAATVAANRGPRDRWRFVAGNAAVLAVLGALAMGLLGVAAEQLALRELSSRWVDGILAGLLFVLATVFARGLLRDRKWHALTAQTGNQNAGRVEVSLPRSVGGWGAVGMITNLTTVSLYVAMAQRIGVSALPLVWQVIILAIVTVLVLLPAWVPMILASVLPGRSAVGPAARQRISSWTRGFALVASLSGAIYLSILALAV